MLSGIQLFVTSWTVCSSTGSSVHGILPATILEWVAIPFSRRSSQSRDQICVSCVSCTGSWVLYHWATWEAPVYNNSIQKMCTLLSQVDDSQKQCWTEEVNQRRIPTVWWYIYITHMTVKSESVSFAQVTLSFVQLFVIPWTVACQDPLSMGFPRKEHWRGLPFRSPRDLPNPGIKIRSPALQVDSLLTDPLRNR